MFKVQDHNLETGEIVLRDPTEDELLQYELDEQIREKQKIDKELALEAKSALLEKLGITEEEAKLLLS